MQATFTATNKLLLLSKLVGLSPPYAQAIMVKGQKNRLKKQDSILLVDLINQSGEEKSVTSAFPLSLPVKCHTATNPIDSHCLKPPIAKLTSLEVKLVGSSGLDHPLDHPS